jgi:hypothetical protein
MIDKNEVKNFHNKYQRKKFIRERTMSSQIDLALNHSALPEYPNLVENYAGYEKLGSIALERNENTFFKTIIFLFFYHVLN